jgi:hypothetical protein
MTERPQDAMTASTVVKNSEGAEDRPLSGVAGAPRLNVLSAQAVSPPRQPEVLPIGPSLAEFRAGEDSRLRDLLAFAMAVEGGRPLGNDGVDALHRRADAELEAHAFRVLHNQVEAIRRQAMDEELARVARRGQSFPGAVLANLVALAIAGAIVLTASRLDPDIFTRLADQLAQLVAQITARF